MFYSAPKFPIFGRALLDSSDVSNLLDDITKLCRNVGNELPCATAPYLSYRLQASTSGGANGVGAPGSRPKSAAKGALS